MTSLGCGWESFPTGTGRPTPSNSRTEETFTAWLKRSTTCFGATSTTASFAGVDETNPACAPAYAGAASAIAAIASATRHVITTA